MTSFDVVLRHRTIYRSEKPVILGPHTIRLHPAPTTLARLRSYALEIHPAPDAALDLRSAGEPAGAGVVSERATDILQIEATLGLDIAPYNPMDFIVDEDIRGEQEDLRVMG